MTTPQEFIYWLQGALEISETKNLNENQTAAIREKLEDCFVKKTNVPPLVHGEPIKYCGPTVESTYQNTANLNYGMELTKAPKALSKVDTGIWEHQGWIYGSKEDLSVNKSVDLLSPPNFYTC